MSDPHLLRIADHLIYDIDFPHPDWDAIGASLQEILDNAVGAETMNRLLREWLEVLRNHLGGSYQVSFADSVVFLSELDSSRVAEEIRFTQKAILTLRECLKENASPPTETPQVIIVFTEDDDYYAYVSRFFPDGHFGSSGGVQIREGISHVAMNPVTFKFREALVHELAHVQLAHLPLPLWVDEGIVQQLTRYVLDQPPREVYTEGAGRLSEAWHWHGLGGFWDGSAFTRPDDLASHAYTLAELLVREMNRRDESAFDRFVAEANAADAGESACRKHFGESLVVQVERLLGAGPWIAPSLQMGESSFKPPATSCPFLPRL